MWIPGRWYPSLSSTIVPGISSFVSPPFLENLACDGLEIPAREGMGSF